MLRGAVLWAPAEVAGGDAGAAGGGRVVPIAPAGVDGEAAAPPEVPRDALGRLVLGLLHTMLPGRLDELQTPRVAGLVRQFRQRVSLAVCCTVLTAPIAIWLLVRGVASYLVTGTKSCEGPLRIWLLGFLMLQLGWPICMPSVALLLFGWCLGAVLLLHETRHCEQVREFVIEASVLQTLQAVMLLVAALAALTARPLVRRLGELLNNSGTDPEVVRHITVLLPDEVQAEEECVICLSREDENGVPWRQLACGHRFHEPCLLEWLAKARRCPVCRLDLHQAHRRAANVLVG